MVKLIVALGNPGLQYEATKHNIARMVLANTSFYSHLKWKKKFKGSYASYDINGGKFYFLQPDTWMNLSGQSIRPMVDFFKIAVEEILIVYDEIDLEFGVVRFKRGGGLAGHNGLKSARQELGNQDFKRMRIGISRPLVGTVSDWVLSPFKGDYVIDLPDVLKHAALALECVLHQGFDRAASKFSGIDIFSNH